jgi:hypothetical protein
MSVQVELNLFDQPGKLSGVCEYAAAETILNIFNK